MPGGGDQNKIYQFALKHKKTAAKDLDQFNALMEDSKYRSNIFSLIKTKAKYDGDFNKFSADYGYSAKQPKDNSTSTQDNSLVKPTQDNPVVEPKANFDFGNVSALKAGEYQVSATNTDTGAKAIKQEKVNPLQVAQRMAESSKELGYWNMKAQKDREGSFTFNPIPVLEGKDATLVDMKSPMEVYQGWLSDNGDQNSKKRVELQLGAVGKQREDLSNAIDYLSDEITKKIGANTFKYLADMQGKIKDAYGEAEKFAQEVEKAGRVKEFDGKKMFTEQADLNKYKSLVSKGEELRNEVKPFFSDPMIQEFSELTAAYKYNNLLYQSVLADPKNKNAFDFERITKEKQKEVDEAYKNGSTVGNLLRSGYSIMSNTAAKAVAAIPQMMSIGSDIASPDKMSVFNYVGELANGIVSDMQSMAGQSSTHDQRGFSTLTAKDVMGEYQVDFDTQGRIVRVLDKKGFAASESESAAVSNYIKDHPDTKIESTNNWDVLGYSVGQMSADLLVQVLGTKGIGAAAMEMGAANELAGKIGTMAMIASQTIPQSYQDGIAAGLDRRQAALYAYAMGAGIGAIGMIGNFEAKLAGVVEAKPRINPFSQMGVRATAGKLTGWDYAKLHVGEVAKDMFKESMEEAVYEPLYQFGLESAINGLTGKKMFSPEEQFSWENIKSNVVITMATTLLTGGMGAGMNFKGVGNEVAAHSLNAAFENFDLYSEKLRQMGALGQINFRGQEPDKFMDDHLAQVEKAKGIADLFDTTENRTEIAALAWDKANLLTQKSKLQDIVDKERIQKKIDLIDKKLSEYENTSEKATSVSDTVDQANPESQTETTPTAETKGDQRSVEPTYPADGSKDISKLSQDDFAHYLQENHSDNLSQEQIYKLLTVRPEFRESMLNESPEEWANRFERNTDYREQNNRIDNSPELRGTSNPGWTGISIGDPTNQATEGRHKGYLTVSGDSVRNLAKNVEKTFRDLHSILEKAGYNGHLKMPGTFSDLLLRFDNIVIHGATQADIDLAIPIIEKYLQDNGINVESTKTGLDVKDSSGKETSHTNALAEKVKNKSLTKPEPPIDNPTESPDAVPTPPVESPDPIEKKVSAAMADEDLSARLEGKTEAERKQILSDYHTEQETAKVEADKTAKAESEAKVKDIKDTLRAEYAAKGLTPEQVESSMAAVDAKATKWALDTGKDKNEYYDQFKKGLQKGNRVIVKDKDGVIGIGEVQEISRDKKFVKTDLSDKFVPIEDAELVDDKVTEEVKREFSPSNKGEFTASNGLTIKEVDGRLVTSKNGVETNRGRKQAMREYAKRFDFTEGKKAEFHEGIREDQANLHISETSDNPAELAKVFLEEVAPEGKTLTEKEQLIAQHGINTTKESFSENDDKNNLDPQMASYFKSRKGIRNSSIDDIAQEMSPDMGEAGIEITPKDITDFMKKFPKGTEDAQRQSESEAKWMARERFKELTGIDLDDEIATEAVNQEVEKLSQQEKDLLDGEYNDRAELEAAYAAAFHETHGFTKEVNPVGVAPEVSREARKIANALTAPDLQTLVEELMPIYKAELSEEERVQFKKDIESGIDSELTIKFQDWVTSIADGKVSPEVQKELDRANSDNVLDGETFATKFEEATKPPTVPEEKVAEVEDTPLSVYQKVKDIFKNIFGLNNKQAKAAAKLADRILGTIAERAGVSKEDAAILIKWQQASEEDIQRLTDAGREVYYQLKGEVDTSKDKQMMVNGEEKTVRPISFDVINGFYSPIEKQLSEMKADKLPAKQWADKLKSEEAKWTGLTDWLNSQEGSISKSDIQKWMKENRIEIVEVVKGGDTDAKTKEYQKKAIEKGKSAGLEISFGSENEIEIAIPGEGDITFDEVDTKSHRKYTAENYGVDESMLETAKELFEENNKVSHNNTPQSETKFSQYQLEGEKSDYKEILVTLPQKELDYKSEHERQFIVGKYNKYIKEGMSHNEALGAIKKYHEHDKTFREIEVIINKKPIEEKKEFKSSHWYEPNILVHLRMNARTDVDGKKVLFLEELQSDWGQEGKKEGFIPIGKEKDDLISEHKKILAEKADIESKIVDLANSTDENRGFELKNLAEKKIELDKKSEELKGKIFKTTTAAPFVTDTNQWVKLGLKVALKEAVKQNADVIAWTTGEQQNERYNLSKSVKKIKAIKEPDGHYTIIGEREGEVMVFHESNIPESKISDYVGKDLAEKIVNGDNLEDLDIMQKANGQMPAQIFEGDDLKIGGKAMIGFYGDKDTKGIIGGVAEKLFGQKVGSTEMIITKGATDFGTDTSAQPSVEITPELKSQVNQGLPLFQKDSEIHGAVEFLNDMAAIIYAVTNPNVSTPLHEITHVYEKYLTDAEKTEVENWSGQKPGTREFSEAFARGFERYLYDGVSPNSKMQKIFDKFREWMHNIYKGVIGQPLNRSMQKIYANMLGVADHIVGIPNPIGATDDYTKELFEAMGRDPIVKDVAREHKKVWQEAMDNVTSGRVDPQVVVENLLNGIMQGEDLTQAYILIDRARISNQMELNKLAFDEAVEKGDERGQLRAMERFAQLEDEIERNGVANDKLGRAAGQMMRFRQRYTDRDYSLATVLWDARKMKVKVVGDTASYDPLTKEEREEFTELALKYKKLSEDLAEAQAKLEAYDAVESERLGQEAVDSFKQKTPTVAKRAKKLADQIRGAKIHKKGGLFAVTDPITPAWDAAIEIAAITIEQGGKLAEAIQKGINLISRMGKLTQEQKDEVVTKFKEYMKQFSPAANIPVLDDAARPFMNKLVREKVEDGLETINEVVDAIYDDLEIPGLTKTELRDYIAGYGVHKKPSADEVAKKIREIKADGRDDAALEAVNRGELPLRSGTKREKPSPEQRRKRAEILRGIKEKGLEPPMTQEEIDDHWASAEDAYIRRLENAIQDVQKEIDDRKLRDKPTGRVFDSDKVKDLQAELDRLKGIRDAMLGTRRASLTTDQKISMAVKATERAIAKIQQGIDNLEAGMTEHGDIYPEKRTSEKLHSAKLDALREQKKLLLEQRDSITPQEVKDQAIIAKIIKTRERTLAGLLEIQKNKDYAKKEKKESHENERIKELNREIFRTRLAIDTAKEKLRLQNLGSWEKFAEFMSSVWDLPKVLRATVDLSAPFNQGLYFLPGHPKIWFKAFKDMFQYAVSAKYSDDKIADLMNDPAYYEMKKHGLFLSVPTARQIADEEYFKSNAMKYIKKFLPPYYKLIVGSERAYSGFINGLRIGVYNNYKEAILNEIANGANLDFDAEMTSYSKIINNGAGRANFGKYEAAANILSIPLWSPRFMVSRWNLTPGTPMWVRFMAEKTPRARKEMIKDQVKFFGTMLGIIGALKFFMGCDDDCVDCDDCIKVELDPRSSDFMKIQIGKLRIELMARLTQMLRLEIQTLTGIRKTSKGELVELPSNEYKSSTIKDIYEEYFRNKLSPSASLLWSAADGMETSMGEPLTLGTAAQSLGQPLSSEQVIQAFREGGVGVGAFSIISILGLPMEYHDDIDPEVAAQRKLDKKIKNQEIKRRESIMNQ